MLKFGVERSADQDGDARHPGPDHEPEHGAGRAVEPVEAAHMLDIPGHCRRAEQPDDRRDDTAAADPAPAWAGSVRAVTIGERKGDGDRGQQDWPAQETQQLVRVAALAGLGAQRRRRNYSPVLAA